MRLVLISLLFLLASCASTSKVEEVEQKILEGQNTISQLDEKIVQLQKDKQKLESQLEFIDSENESQAMGIREKIALIDQSIGNYQSEISQINTFLGQHSAQITAVENQQTQQKNAVSEAVKKNEALKQQAAEEIRALERAYDEKRRKKDESDESN